MPETALLEHCHHDEMSPVRRPYHYLLRSMPERSERLSDRGGVAVAVTQQSVASGSG